MIDKNPDEMAHIYERITVADGSSVIVGANGHMVVFELVENGNKVGLRLSYQDAVRMYAALGKIIMDKICGELE